jgi:hypothetical protein
MSNYSTCLITTDIDQASNDYDGYIYYFTDATNNDINITLTTNYVSNGLYYYFNRIDSSTYGVTLTAPTGYTINNNSSLTLSVNQSCEIIFQNDNWIASRFDKV